MSISLTIEKGEATIENIFIVAIMYFTYSQLWLFVAIKGMIEYLKDIIFKERLNGIKQKDFDSCTGGINMKKFIISIISLVLFFQIYHLYTK